ncbi:MAG TPA: mechanosensitive ion channel family protein [Chloroflexota bacterium]
MGNDLAVFGLSLENADLVGRIVIAAIVVVVTIGIVRVLPPIVERLIRHAIHTAGLTQEEQLQRVHTLTAAIQAAAIAAILVVGLLTALAALGTPIGPLLASAGVVGLALGLGAQSLIKDIIAGFFVLLEDQYRVGEVVRINDQFSGQVEELNLRRTVLRGLDGSATIIANGEIRVVTNLTREWSRVVLDVSVSYRENVRQVMDVMRRVGVELWEDPSWRPLLLEEPQVLGVENFSESGVVVRMLAKTRPLKQWDVGRELRARLKEAFDREGIAIALPHRVVLQPNDARWSAGSPVAPSDV